MKEYVGVVSLIIVIVIKIFWFMQQS